MDGIADESRRRDCEALAIMMAKATKEPPRMWGTSIVEFGSHNYKYESGRESDSCLAGFSSRKGDISLYLTFASWTRSMRRRNHGGLGLS